MHIVYLSAAGKAILLRFFVHFLYKKENEKGRLGKDKKGNNIDMTKCAFKKC